jgi:hypothetical protein
MRFDPLFCPECGEMARGTLETITGVAEFDASDNGSVEYSGYTEINWDGQETVTDDGGNARLVCPNGHDWPARMLTSTKGGDPCRPNAIV